MNTSIVFAGRIRVEFTVHGRPAPQGSKNRGRYGSMYESSKNLKPWRADVKAAAEELLAGYPNWVPLDGPLTARMVFTMPKPLSAPKLRKTWPNRKPDLSKLVRATEDALTDAGIWRDDARVVEYTRIAKVFPFEDDDALRWPGALIIIEEVAPPNTAA